MIRNISIGIDVGSFTTRVVVGEFVKGEKYPKIIGVGEAPSAGMRHGYITNFDEAAASVRRAVDMAEKASGVRVRRAFVGVGGATLRGDVYTGTAIVSKADGEVTTLDLTKALEDGEGSLGQGNRKVIQVSPISFKLDGKEVLGRPEGMRGNKLEVRALYVTISNQHLESMLEAVAEAGVETIDVVPSVAAASNIALAERQKVVGAAVASLGSETVSLAVYENGVLVSLHTFSLGSSDITNDIALGLKLTLEEAENLKTGATIANFSKKKLDEIVEARLSDIFELIDTHLKRIKRSGLLPAGIVWIGGGSAIPGLLEQSKLALGLPARVGNSEFFGNNKTKLRDSSWFSALGLLTASSVSGAGDSSFRSVLKDLKNTIRSVTKQLLP